VTSADGLRFCGMVRNMPDLPKESASARYRRLAQECLEVARTFPDGERRTVLLQMAQVWLRLAQEQSGNETLDLGEGVSVPPTATAGGRPVVQKQQQVEPEDDDVAASSYHRQRRLSQTWVLGDRSRSRLQGA
jgi:hypothetical protein